MKIVIELRKYFNSDSFDEVMSRLSGAMTKVDSVVLKPLMLNPILEVKE